ncbi:MAG: hypothetical protein GEU81_10150 [Nitriliruptorales bacterium]|nr:hypothetical protein [Nitriliruptorales bacterium]
MNYWEGPPRWINAALLFIVGFLAFDALFKLLNAQETNVIVGFVSMIAGIFLVPFNDMFANQPDLLTSAIAVMGYCLVVGIVLAVLRSVQASRQEARRAEAEMGDQTQQF